jgi:ABC-type Na+ efflux pump permease subunit
VLLPSFVVYFVLGYLFYAAVMVGIGAACNTLKDAQGFMTPITLIVLVPMFAIFPVTQDPNGTIARVLSFVPPYTPFVMMNRAAGPPATWEYVATTIELLLAVIAALWVAAKVFRVGVLMTGTRPRLSEILRWITAPVGSVPERQ